MNAGSRVADARPGLDAAIKALHPRHHIISRGVFTPACSCSIFDRGRSNGARLKELVPRAYLIRLFARKAGQPGLPSFANYFTFGFRSSCERGLFMFSLVMRFRPGIDIRLDLLALRGSQGGLDAIITISGTGLAPPAPRSCRPSTA